MHSCEERFQLFFLSHKAPEAQLWFQPHLCLFLSPESVSEVDRAYKPVRQEGAKVVIRAIVPPRWEGAGIAIGIQEPIR